MNFPHNSQILEYINIIVINCQEKTISDIVTIVIFYALLN